MPGQLANKTTFTLSIFFTGDKDVYVLDEKDVLAFGTVNVITGQITTPCAVGILLGMLVNYQDVQERAYREIQDAIGDRTPTTEDKSKMPYVEALILESMRYGANVPLGTPHCTSEDVELNGYIIPKGTLVIPNVWSISHDPRYVKIN